MITMIYSFLQSSSFSQEDINFPVDNKEEDDGSDDETDDKINMTHDSERLKAFNVG